MPGFTVKARQRGSGPGPPSSRAADHVGEIDTAAPIQSVKAAVTLFGAVGSFRSRPVTRRSDSNERLLEKETQHDHVMLRELDRCKDHLKSVETAKARALEDLQTAKRTLQELTRTIESLSELKQASIKATEAAKIRVEELEAQKTHRAHLSSDAWKDDLKNERESCKASTGQLIACKQELAKLREDFIAALELKLTVSQKVEEAQHKVQTHQERQSQLENEVEAIRKMIGELELTSHQAEEEHSRIIMEKESCLQARKSAKEEAEREIKRLREEYEPAESLREKLEETTEEVKALQEQAKEIHSSDLYALKITFSELEKSKKSLEESLEGEKSLQSSINLIKQELEEVKNKRSESEKSVEVAPAAGQMKGELQKIFELEEMKTELEAAMSGCATTMQSSINKLLLEAERAMRDAEESKEKAELLKKETEASRLATEEAEEKLKAVLEEAKAAKTVAADKVYKYSGPGREIRVSAEEFESMNKKIKGFGSEADMKVAIAKAQKETIATSEKVISKKLANVLKENEAIEMRIKDAVKKAMMADAARSIVETELQKWRQNEYNKSTTK